MTDAERIARLEARCAALSAQLRATMDERAFLRERLASLERLLRPALTLLDNPQQVQ